MIRRCLLTRPSWPAGLGSRVERRRLRRAGACPMPSIGKTRGWLYLVARLLGDVNAIRRGRVGKRIGRRLAGKATGRLLWRIFR